VIGAVFLLLAAYVLYTATPYFDIAAADRFRERLFTECVEG
jgi:hypothetical protein